MHRLLPLLRRYAGDALVLLLAAAAQIEVWAGDRESSRAALAVFALGWTLPLLARRRLPLAAPVAAAVAVAAAGAILDYDLIEGLWTPAFVAFLVSPWLLAASNELRRALVGEAVVIAGIAVLAAAVAPIAADFLFVVFLSAAAFTAGAALNTRTRRTTELAERGEVLERIREEEARQAVSEERTRIARELHDVIAHSVSVMTVQAAAARMLLDDSPERALAPVTAVEETGREALAELRRLLGILRRAFPEGEDSADVARAPQPGMANLDTLLAQVRAAGCTVDLEVEGTPVGLAPGLDLAAFRIVQQSLAGVAPTQGSPPVVVRVRHSPGALELQVDGGAGPDDENGGQGLVGMRERVGIYGGTITSGSLPDGRYRVTARLPLETA
jgi:signal transduction histidine kinase